jgi:predicted HNH restriction endonuclease
VHHRVALNKSAKSGRETKLSDLAIVCANCHVMIHKGGECRELAGLIPGR